MKMLDKFRRLNNFMQKTSAEPVDFGEITDVLCNLLECNVYVVSRKGKILGQGVHDSFTSQIVEEKSVEEGDELRLPRELNERLWETEKPTLGSWDGEGEWLLNEDDGDGSGSRHLAIIPAYGGSARMGTLLLARMEEPFAEEELVLGEYGATVVGLEILRSKYEKEETRRKKQMEARGALNTLSYSELEVVSLLFEDFEGDEQLFVTSEVADQAGISRSVVVNALGKLESAGVIDSRSLGMKGTNIKILNEYFLDELKDMQ